MTKKEQSIAEDRELLELAARAAGMEVEWHEGCGEALAYSEGAARAQPWLRYWNPLSDDGDALRLAVKLRLDIETSLIYAGAISVDRWDESTQEYISTQEPDGDPYAATRRAIVRAAAALAERTTE